MFRGMLLTLAVGCGFEHGVPAGTAGDGGTDSTSPDDSMTVAPADAQECWSVPSVGIDVCLNDPPSGTTNVTSNTSIDTGSSGTGSLQCAPLRAGSSDVCVIAASSISVAAMRTLSAHGARPLVLLATTIQIDGTIDVASHVNGQTGAGANMSGCSAGSDPADDEGGGGQGGSFGAKGGNGGAIGGENDTRGTAGNVLATATLRGGCPGGSGGDSGGAGGDGGGAVLLVAQTITFGTAGRINASGASGRGAQPGVRGGGGGGSGGMIALSAATITVGTNTQLFANGGHGGGGSDSEDPGGSGTDPTSATSTGGGGSGSEEAGDGGDGYPATSRDGGNGTGGSGPGGGEDAGGAGGGGGGAGVIRNDSSSSLGTGVSPAPT